jgi:hypothetical protein
VLVLTSSATVPGPVVPASELQQLAPLLGAWTGTGELRDPSGATTGWTARGVYSWALGGHFVREDFRIGFAGAAAPLVFRAHLGWDREQRRFVNAMVDNSGEVDLHEFRLLPDGSHLQLMRKVRQGVPYAERTLTRFDGDSMAIAIDMLLPNGASTTVVAGRFTRAAGIESEAAATPAPVATSGPPHASLAALQRSAGVYAVQGLAVLQPGGAAAAFAGSERVGLAMGGTVVHACLQGEAEGLPAPYVGETWWGHDAERDCLVAVHLNNLGDARKVDARWTPDGQLVVTGRCVQEGRPAVQRIVRLFAGDGAATAAVGHAIVGTEPPFESLRATYSRQR